MEKNRMYYLNCQQKMTLFYHTIWITTNYNYIWETNKRGLQNWSTWWGEYKTAPHLACNVHVHIQLTWSTSIHNKFITFLIFQKNYRNYHDHDLWGGLGLWGWWPSITSVETISHYVPYPFVSFTTIIISTSIYLLSYLIPLSIK